jgi:energy-coupling factor transport system permease protein
MSLPRTMSFARPSATAALALGAEAAVLGFLLERPLNLALLAALAGAWAAPAVPRRAWPWLLAGLGLTSWSLMATQGLFYEGLPRTALLRLLPPGGFPFGDPPGLYVYREGLVYGLLQSLRGLALLLIAAGLVGRYGLEELSRGLRALGLPGPLGLLAVLAVRQVPLLAAEARTVWVALRLKGLAPAAALRAGLIPLLAAHVRRADETAAALWSRGLGTRAGEPAPPPLRPAERVAVWSMAGLLAALTGAVLLTRLHQAGVLSLRGWEPLLAWMLTHV